MPNYTYKVYSFEVTAPGQSVSPTFDIDKNVQTVVGIVLDANQRNSIYTYGSSRVEIGGQELYPTGFRAHMLMLGINAPKKYIEFDPAVPAGTGKLLLNYQDDAPASAAVVPAGGVAAWVPYTVRVTIACTITK